MKSCPQCSLNYSDDTLEFCLEDGSRLAASQNFSNETPTITRPQTVNPMTAQTVNLPFSGAAKTLESVDAPSAATIQQSNPLKENLVQQRDRVLEIAPFIIALAHNWWQWIYLNSQYYSSFSTYILSANFLMWLLLLTIGAGIGLLALRRCQNKSFAVASLVILSINLILFLVPKR